jgi:hypothetical protein
LDLAAGTTASAHESLSTAPARTHDAVEEAMPQPIVAAATVVALRDPPPAPVRPLRSSVRTSSSSTPSASALPRVERGTRNIPIVE